MEPLPAAAATRTPGRLWRAAYDISHWRPVSPVFDWVYDRRLRSSGDLDRMRQAAAAYPQRNVLLAAVDVPARRQGLNAAVKAFQDTHHKVDFVSAPMESRGKFENINAALTGVDLAPYDWLIVFDDDIRLRPRFLDDFLFLSEYAGLAISQPAHLLHSYRTFSINCRVYGSLLRKTRFVESGPVTAFHRSLVDRVVPFPTNRYGWGTDMIWSNLALSEGKSIGVVDATPVEHMRPVAGSYDRGIAQEDMLTLLADHGITDPDFGPYVVTEEVIRTLPAAL